MFLANLNSGGLIAGVSTCTCCYLELLLKKTYLKLQQKQFHLTHLEQKKKLISEMHFIESYNNFFVVFTIMKTNNVKDTTQK